MSLNHKKSSLSFRTGHRSGKHPVLKRILIIFLLLIVVMAAGSFAYVSDYYHAEDAAWAYIDEETDGVTVDQSQKNQIAFLPSDSSFSGSGIIFYPGAKVQYESYAPLMHELAEHGVLCVLLHMPGNLAVLDINAADGVQEEYPQVTDWYLAGHSLGGAMGANYISKHTDAYKGLILCAAYSTADLTQSGLKVLSVYGSEDHVLKMDTYEKDKENLPADFTECIIEGGCHAWFGCYGAQKGDGTPSISQEAQWEAVTESLVSFLN